MSPRWITAKHIFDGDVLHAGVALAVEDDRVTALKPVAELPAGAHPDHLGHLITPGFFDIQVNGGGGVLLNTSPTRDGVLAIAAAHRALGTTALLPTVITDSADIMDAAADAVIAAHGQAGVMGIHIEGPHIAVARKGTHNPTHIRPLDERTFATVARLRAANVPVLVTLAPEAVQPGQIAQLGQMGAVVSIGHSDATLEQVREAEAEGVHLFTHLYNAMSPMLNRAPGVTGAAITSGAYCSVICDGIHVAPEMLQIAIAARPVGDRMILVSDAMPTVGGPEAFDLYGRSIRVEDGRLVNAEGSLAGAHTTMAQSLRFAVARLGVPLEAALRMAISNPARLMGLAGQFAITGQAVNELLVQSDGLDLTPAPAPARV